MKALAALRLAALLLPLAACTTLERAIHIHSGAALEARTFTQADGQASLYYAHRTPVPGEPDTALFLIGGSGCASWKALMPHYVAGFARPAHVFAVNKRHIDDVSLGVLPCSRRFHEHNHISQWTSDYAAFVRAMLAGLPVPPRHVVLVGVSEGALPATLLAAQERSVTHLALIGFGGWSIRRSMQVLFDQGRGDTNPADLQKLIERAPHSLTDEINGHPYRWWHGVLDIDPMPTLKRLDLPIIVGMGEADASVPAASAVDLERQFSLAGKRNAQIHLYPGADHRLQASGRSYRVDFFGELAACMAGKCTGTPR